MPKLKFNTKYFSLFITVLLFFILFGMGSCLYRGFFSLQVFLNLFIDNACLIVIAVGITFVLIIGGIDISVGSVIALVCMSSAYLLENKHFNPFATIALMLLMGAAFGLVQGCLIHFFKLQPFIVTLAGLFFGRGMTAVINTDTINITNPVYVNIANARIHIFGKAFISPNVLIALTILAIAIYIAHYTKFGRTVYAIGGNEQSAILMGIPVGRTKVLVYTLSGVCSAIAGIIFSFYMLSGYTLHGQGMEMDAIAAAVIGGTALTGGVGYVFGTLFGVLVTGIIQTLIMFQGTLSSWWTRIAIAALLCLFIIIQSLITSRKGKKKVAGKLSVKNGLNAS
jgi:galactofuranose transport system permease protein